VFGDRRDRAITTLPSLLEYLGYCFNVTTVLVGPIFEFGVYAREQRQWGNGNLPPPVPRLPAVLVTLLLGVFFMVLNALLQPMVPIEGVFELAAKPGGSFWRLLLFLHVSYLARRIGYYAVWKVAEAAAVTAGFGHQQATGCAAEGASKQTSARSSRSSRSAKQAVPSGIAASENNTSCIQRTRASVVAWNGAANINPLACELPGSPSDVMRNWNIHVQSWLQRYVYLRAPRAYGLNRLATFFASALWHGIAVGYFAGFLSLPIMQAAWSEVASLWACWQPPAWAAGLGSAGRLIRAGCSVLRRVVRAGATLLLLDYCLSAFTMLELGKTVVVWRGLWFFGHVGAAIILASGCALRRSGLRRFRSSFAAL
jgi:lysophospholipid acyltransferase